MIKEYPENRYKSMLKILKNPSNVDIPVVIKGGGALAEKVRSFLRESGISIECFLIDRQYYKLNDLIAETPVQIFEDYVSKQECILIIAYRGYDLNQIPANLMKNIKYLFDYDFIGRLVLPEDYLNPISEEYLQSRKEDVKWIYSNLADKKSEKALDDYLYQRIYGNYSKNYDSSQYFQDDIIELTNKEVFIDCGAFQGETLIDFIKYAKEKGITSWEKLIAFEPEPANIEVMKKNVIGIPNIQIEQAGVYSSSKIFFINSGNGSNSTISDKGNLAIKVKSVDDVLAGDRATFIKMDIEGSEMEGLIGARETIKKYKPKLAISIYHKREDFIDIPRYIMSLRDDYNFYIRNHDSAGIECIFYAV